MFDQELITKTLQAHKFQFRGICGSGGFAKIYLVFSEKYKMEFCAKVVKIDVSIREEINIILGLEHPNIIRIFDFFEDEKYQYLIMENCTGGSLTDLLNKFGPLDDGKVLEYAYATASALYFCHGRNIAHLDIKPSNLLLDSNGRLKVCDFGLSKIVAKGQKLDVVSGSLPFLPPEVVQGSDYDPFLADIWSLGITLYVLLCGKTPWIGFSKLDIKKSIIESIIPTKPIENSILCTTILKMVQQTPEKRIHIEALVSTLKELQNSKEMNKSPGTINKGKSMVHLAKKSTLNGIFVSVGMKRRTKIIPPNNSTLAQFPNAKAPLLGGEALLVRPKY